MQELSTVDLNKSKIAPAAAGQGSNGSEMNYLQLSEDYNNLLQGAADGLSGSTNFLQHLLGQTSENGSIINSQDPEYTASIFLNSGNNNQSISAQNQRQQNDHGNFYSNLPQNEYHPYNQMNGMYHASPTHTGTPSHSGMSPSNMAPSSPKKSPTVNQLGEKRFTFPSHAQPVSPYGHLAHATSPTSSMQALPETARFSGSYDFELSFGPPTDGATKSIDYTYSHPLRKLYVQRGAHCPFKFKSGKNPPEGSYIKVLPVYKGTHVLSEPVKRCSNHAMSEEEAGNSDATSKYHFVRSDNSLAQYEQLENGRLCVTFPYTGPQPGAEFQTELLSFQCFNSCGNSAHAKRRIDVIFTLENQNQVLGRQVIEVRVCACPGRDRQNEELNQSGGHRKRRTSSYLSHGSKRKRTTSNNEEYTLKTQSPRMFEILSKIQNLLEPFIDDQSIEGQSLSPASNASSPRQGRNQTVPESESEAE